MALYNAYIRLETLETAMIAPLSRPSSLPTCEFQEVIKLHFREAWYDAIRPDLLAWADKNDFEEGKEEGGREELASISGQILRMSWFRQAIGPGMYKKMMLALIEKMDELVEGAGGQLSRQGGRAGGAGLLAGVPGGGKMSASATEGAAASGIREKDLTAAEVAKALKSEGGGGRGGGGGEGGGKKGVGRASA